MPTKAQKPIESIDRHQMENGEYVFIVRRTGATDFTANSYQEISHAKRALDEYCEKNGFTELKEFIAAKRQEVIDKKEARKKEAAERRDRKRAAVEAMDQTCRRSKRVAALSQARTAFKPTPASPAPSSSAPSSSSIGSFVSNNSQILPASANSPVLKNAPTSSTRLKCGLTRSSTGNPSSRNSAEKENKSGKKKSTPKDDVVFRVPTGVPSKPSSSASKRPSSSSDSSKDGAPSAKQPASSSTTKVEESTPRYQKYDKIPEEWIEKEWWSRTLFDPTKPRLTFHYSNEEIIILGDKQKDQGASTSRDMALEPVRIQSSNEYVMFIQAFQNCVNRLNQLDTNHFEGLVRHLGSVADKLVAGTKDKALALYVVQMDTFMYKIFAAMKPFQQCDEEAVQVRFFFETFKASVDEYWTGNVQTRQDIMLILDSNIGPLRTYGEKMVIPCHSIVEHLTAFATLLMEEYPRI
ncbi:hypothetical protein CAEBREN_17917 [Caenorhabditis brenneri]|uniref:Uncharacterized protein n=1 Tax=Caenorhabditis brenneri TaxID=135651 RepID=G0NKW2_CAEBE|nr:hypothetical protein CAEBREN_17917 [Caenorhabditis brenneri]